MPPRVHLVRHGQGQHQVDPLEKNRRIRDPYLTEHGVEACRRFNDLFPEYIHLDLICASPMRRTIQTAAYCFANWIPKTAQGNIMLQPLAQENTSEPCDVGSDPEVLEDEFGKLIDGSNVSKDWFVKEGANASTPDALKERARLLRCWLRDRQERDIVVVGHGAFWDYMINALGDDGLLLGPESTWINCEWRSFHFGSNTDEEATLVEDVGSIARRRTLNLV